MKAVFLDRDGTINLGIPFHERVDSVDKVALFPDTVAALTELAKLDYLVFFVTNQAGIAEGLITMDQFNVINNKVIELISPSGIEVKETLVCPHGEGSTCDCRKPKPKLLQDAAQKYGIDLGQSWMLGDRRTDVLTGVNAGTKTILVKTGEQHVEAAEATYTASSLTDAVRYIAQHS